MKELGKKIQMDFTAVKAKMLRDMKKETIPATLEAQCKFLAETAVPSIVATTTIIVRVAMQFGVKIKEKGANT